MLLRKIARPLLGSAFVASGVDALMSPATPARTAQPVLDAGRSVLPGSVTSAVPNEAETVIRVAGAVQVGAGLALALGKGPRIASTVLAGTLVPTTLFASDFWNEQDPALKAAKRSAFTKNVGLLGGVLIAAADTEGKPSLAWRGRRKVAETSAAVADRLPSRAQANSRWDDLAERGQQGAHELAENSAHLAEVTRAKAADLAETVSDRAPDVIDAVRSRAEKFATEVADRAPGVAEDAKSLALQAGDETAKRARRLRRSMAS